jgi:hypothetical protein
MEGQIQQEGDASNKIKNSLVTANGGSIQLDNLVGVQDWIAGQIGYDPGELTVTIDSGINGVRLQAGQEEWYLVWNNTAGDIVNGKPVYASGIYVPGLVVTGALADATKLFTSAQILGLATHTIPKDSLGLVTYRGMVRAFPTDTLEFNSLTYLGVQALTSEKPLHPVQRISMGVLIKKDISDGQFLVTINRLTRQDASRSYSTDPGALGIDYIAGYYDWKATSVTLDEGSPTTTYGDPDASKAAHIGIVSNGVGVVVGGGQVGLKAVGVLDSETGIQVAAQDMIITEDITTLTANTRFEATEKGSGTYSLELYVVSGTPTAYSLTCNTGYSKYEDKQNVPMTILGIEAQWKGTQTDNGMNIELMHDRPENWIFASSGFVPGNGNIVERLVDQALVSGVRAGQNGAYKRSKVNTFVAGDSDQGYVLRVTTTQNNSLKDVNITVPAVNENL